MSKVFPIESLFQRGLEAALPIRVQDSCSRCADAGPGAEDDLEPPSGWALGHETRDHSQALPETQWVDGARSSPPR
jgi:hypothetical protein